MKILKPKSSTHAGFDPATMASALRNWIIAASTERRELLSLFNVNVWRQHTTNATLNVELETSSFSEQMHL